MEHPTQKSNDYHAANTEVNASKASAAAETKPAAAVIAAILNIVADSAGGPLHGFAESTCRANAFCGTEWVKIAQESRLYSWRRFQRPCM